MSRPIEMIIVDSSDEESKPNRERHKIQAAETRRPLSRDRERNERSRTSRFSVPHDVIRDGIVFVDENYYQLLRRFLEQINYQGGLKREMALRLIEKVDDATPAERRRILLPPELEHYRSRLMYCELVFEGLPSGVFFGSGFGPKREDARASASKDLTDKLLKLGIFTRELCDVATRIEKKAKIRIPHFKHAAEAIINIVEFMGRELWPSDVMTARELDPDVIERLKRLFDKAIRRAYEKVPEHPVHGHRRSPIPEQHSAHYLHLKRDAMKRCAHCQESGHNMEHCALLMQQMELKKRQASYNPVTKTHFPSPYDLMKQPKTPAALPYNGPIAQDLFEVQKKMMGRTLLQMPGPHNAYGLVPSPTPIVNQAYTEMEIRRRVEAELKEKERILEEQIREKILREEKEKLERQLKEETNELLQLQRREELDRKTLLPTPGYSESPLSQSYSSALPKRPVIYDSHAALPILNAYADYEKKNEEPPAKVGTRWISRKGSNGYGLGTAFGLVKDGHNFVKPGVLWLSPADPIAKIQRLATDCEDTIEILERRIEGASDIETLESLMQAVAELGQQAKGMPDEQQILMLTQLQQLLNQALDEKRRKSDAQFETQRHERGRLRSPEATWRGRLGKERTRSRSRSPHRESARIFVQAEGRSLVLTSVSRKERLQPDEKLWAQDFKTGKWEPCRLIKVIPPESDGAGHRIILKLLTGFKWKRKFEEVFRERF